MLIRVHGIGEAGLKKEFVNGMSYTLEEDHPAPSPTTDHSFDFSQKKNSVYLAMI